MKKLGIGLIMLWFLAFLLPPALAQTVPLGPRFVLPYQTVIDPNGVPLPGALLYFYVSGTTTPLNTYSDPLLTTPNTNPVVANSAGVFPNIFLSGNYKVVLTDSSNNQQWTADPVLGVLGNATVTPFVVGTTPITGGSAPCVLVNSTGTTSACIDLTNSYLAAGTFTNITGVGQLGALGVGEATPSAGNINISGQYQIAGSQIAASSLSNGTTGTGSIVLAAAPTISGAATFSGVPVLSGLSSGTCSNGLGINASNQTILISCPGAASSIQVGGTSVTSGTSGSCLYDNAGTLGNLPCAGQPPGGRLTLQSGHPVQNADQANKSTIYYDCAAPGNSQVPIYNGSNFASFAITSCEISFGLSTANITKGNVYDVFAVVSGGSAVACAGPAWTTPSGNSAARSVNIHNTLGFYTVAATLTHCYGGVSGTTDYGSISSDDATYLGSFLATANGQTSEVELPTAANGGTANTCGVFNAYNPVPIICKDQDSTSSWVSEANSFVVPCNASDWAVSFTGTISPAGTLTVSAVGSGTLAIGQYIFGSGISQPEIITAFGSGTGGTGTYTVSGASTTGSEAMTASNISNRVTWVDGLGFGRIKVETYNSFVASSAASTAGGMEVGINKTTSNGGGGNGALVEQPAIGASFTSQYGSADYADLITYGQIGANTAYCLEGGANVTRFGGDFFQFFATLNQ